MLRARAHDPDPGKSTASPPFIPWRAPQSPVAMCSDPGAFPPVWMLAPPVLGSLPPVPPRGLFPYPRCPPPRCQDPHHSARTPTPVPEPLSWCQNPLFPMPGPPSRSPDPNPGARTPSSQCQDPHPSTRIPIPVPGPPLSSTRTPTPVPGPPPRSPNPHPGPQTPLFPSPPRLPRTLLRASGSACSVPSGVRSDAGAVRGPAASRERSSEPG